MRRGPLAALADGRVRIALAVLVCALLVCTPALASTPSTVATTTAKTTTTTKTTTTKSTTTASTTAVLGNASMGKRIFQEQQCGSCHMMAAANAMDASGVGPDLDHVTKTYAQIVKQISAGGGGMTPYKSVLTTAQIDDLAAFIYTNSHPA